jgi:hypothetical protein
VFGSNTGGGQFYQWLIRNAYPPGFQVLCWNCNAGRHINGGTCPHQVDISKLSQVDNINYTRVDISAGDVHASEPTFNGC